MAETKRSIGQVIFRHTPGSLIAIDEYGVYGEIVDIRGEPDADVDKNTLFRRIKWFVNKWNDESNGRIRGFELNDLERDSFVAIRPERVIWELMPQMLFECIDPNCKVTISISDKSFDGRCPRCNRALRQFRYIWFHTCGNLKPFLPILQVECPNPEHKRKYLYLHDTGRFKSSSWRCRECTYERRLGMLPCKEGTCLSIPKNESFLRASVWNDPWVYFPQVITFVNLKDEEIKPILESNLREELLLSSYLGLIEAGQDQVKDKAESSLLSVKCIKCGFLNKLGSKFCNNCGEKQPEISEGTGVVTKENLPTQIFTDDSELMTFVALRDLTRTVSFRDKKNKLIEDKDFEKKTYFDSAFNTINQLGFYDISLIGEFPLTYAAIGYTRFQSKPQVWLRAFPSTKGTGTKIPVYTNCITTEALMIQLSASYILKWLSVNKLVPESLFSEKLDQLNETDAQLWLLKFMNEEVDDLDKIKVKEILKELLHSLSHTFLQSLSIESGLDVASFGEVLLPNAMTFIVYAGESDVGGVTATFNQSIGALLDSLSDQLRSCKFDPSCSEDDGGACVGCLQLPRGCVNFNEKLSRAYIFGGKTRTLSADEILVGYFDLKNL